MQVQPSGLAIVHLPYCDEVRNVTRDPKVLADVGKAARAPPAAVAAAAALVDAMSDDTVTRFTFRNTEAEFAASVMRAKITSPSADAPEALAHHDSMQHYLNTRAPVPAAVIDAFLNDVRARLHPCLPAAELRAWASQMCLMRQWMDACNQPVLCTLRLMPRLVSGSLGRLNRAKAWYISVCVRSQGSTILICVPPLGVCSSEAGAQLGAGEWGKPGRPGGNDGQEAPCCGASYDHR